MSEPQTNSTAIAGSSPVPGSPSSAHDKAWEKGFIVPIAKEMKARGVAYLVITIRDDGKAAYVLEPVEKPQEELGWPYDDPSVAYDDDLPQFHPENVQAVAPATLDSVSPDDVMAG